MMKKLKNSIILEKKKNEDFNKFRINSQKKLLKH